MQKVDLRQIVASKRAKTGKTFFIAVDGRGGSGKSTLANWLAERLGDQLVRTDDFANWNNPLNWWPIVIERIFEPVRNGTKTLSYPRSKWWENHFPEPVENQAVTDIMILEGVGSSRREFQDYISLKIFVDTPKEICLRRGIERDSCTGKTSEELTEMWKGWIKAEDEYIRRDQPRLYADITIDGTEPPEEQLLV